MNRHRRNQARKAEANRLRVRCREAFESTGLSQSEVGRRMGVPASRINDFLTGRCDTFRVFDGVALFAKAIGVPVDHLLD